ncbi:MAG: hypothetical protein S4CHLAM45_05830 [Chlamydiales bacterium]|nr:hypothetical protein [Chlamydiales bacterium]MCH9619876.1 hypothetical protein [Chlamydiales bacterium]MCH9622697.1 hypothetical protein [Chlamydiales bacterium]
MDQQTTQHQPKLTPLQTFVQQFEQIEQVEEKLSTCIEFMRAALSKEQSPDFKGFWEVRKICFPLFKEPLSSHIRSEMWNQYIELTREGRQLKNMLDEESSFAVEQIDLAIAALEKEVEDPQSVSLKMPKQPKALDGRFSLYENLQKELAGLNVFATRINALRKELIKTEMRIRHKNKFFQRLSVLGDRIFPRRKELIKELSETFTGDVETFMEAHFSEKNFCEENARRSVFFFREEIKSLQALAKHLTINTQAFTSTRHQLSECWDMLRGLEKELKKEHVHLKQKSHENTTEALEQIKKITDRFTEGELPYSEGLNELKEVAHWMRKVELTKGDVHQLKEALKEARAPMEALLDEELREQKERADEVERERKEKVEAFKNKLTALQEEIKTETIEALQGKLEAIKSAFITLSMTKAERQIFDRMIKDLREQMIDKEEAAILALPDDAKEQLDALQAMLVQRLEKRKEVKKQIEEFRQVIGGSNLDFESAMKYNELMVLEKKSLEKTDLSIMEIEKKIKDIKNQN